VQVATLRKDIANVDACLKDAHSGRIAAEDQAASLRTQVQWSSCCMNG